MFRSGTSLCRWRTFNVFSALSFYFAEESKKDICSDRTPLVSHSKMDPGQDCLTINAGQEFDSRPRMVRHSFVQSGESARLGLYMQYLSRLTNVKQLQLVDMG